MFWKTLISASLLATASASPVPTFESQIKGWFNAERASLNIVKTTTTPRGQSVDWIPLESQGKVASPPPLPEVAKPDGRIRAVPELHLDGAQLGPAGTVPVLKKNLNGISYDRSLSQFLGKAQGQLNNFNHTSKLETRAGSGTHRYASSQQRINNYGSGGHLNIWNPYVQTRNDFSLLQTGIVNDQQGYLQTVEAGWQEYPALNGDTATHLFTYYTTNGYASNGNNVGGYNRDVQGWVQYSSSIFPGTIFTPYSVMGGQQYDITIRYQLYQGNWWFFVQGQWIGYYPASLFAKSGTTTNTLGGYGTIVGWWGEVYDDQTEVGGRTTTDMGSGRFPSAGGNYAAFMDYLFVQTNAAGSTIGYDGSAGIYQPDPSMYQIQGYWNSGTSFGSYAYLGGPGSG